MVYEEIERVVAGGRDEGGSGDALKTDSFADRHSHWSPRGTRAKICAVSCVYGRLEAVNDWEKQVRRVGSDDVKRVARKYLTPANRTVMIVNPGGKP